jgi:gamma-glutamyltranspeptidase / glutathione hydrolase
MTIPRLPHFPVHSASRLGASPRVPAGPHAPVKRTRTGSRALLPAWVACLLVLTACEAGIPSPVPPSAVPHADITFPESWRFPADAEPVTAANGMVVTTDEHATRVGLDILQAGGTAMDAAIAVSFALAVVNPAAGNIGGGGFMVTRLADGETSALDYRERAPLAATRDMYLDAAGELSDRSVLGHLAAGVPGTVMGMWEAHQRHATMEWGELVQPAIDLAEGFEVRDRLARSLRGSRQSLSIYETTREIFLPGGEPPEVGDFFRQPDLARTLTRIRDEGPDGFYRGETADLIVAEMERGGGIITHEDLSTYRTAWRDPITFTYRGYSVTSMPPSSSGGATMALMAHMLEPYDLNSMGWHSAETIHLMTEVWKRAYSDRNQALADPDFVAIPLAEMVSQEYADRRGADIRTDRVTPSTEIGPGLEVGESLETTHYSVVDRWGNAVAVTTTINSGYGSKVTVAGAGFLLNNEMDDFAAKPGYPNQFGLVQGEQNAIEPGKRMLSAMTPTIVSDLSGDLLFVTGTPGGSTIITTVFQTLLNVVDFGMSVSQAVNAPRVHHQHLPDLIYYENGGLFPEVIEALEALGHTLQQRGGTSGDVQAIMVLPDGSLAAHADPRLGGTALGY